MHSLLQAIKAALTSRRTPWLLLAVTVAAIRLDSVMPRARAWLAPPKVTVLSTRIRDRGREYVKGLQLVVSGDAVLGDDLLAASTDRLSRLADDCAHTDGCDVETVVGALAAAIERHPRTKAKPIGVSRFRLWLDAKAAAAVATPPTAEAVSTGAAIDLAAATPFNAPVKRALADWLTWNRPQLVDAHENYLYLREQLVPIYAEAGLPEALLFGLLAQETGGKVHAYSSAGAAGPLQFMPVTARRYGLLPESGFDMRLDPVAATRASAAYLRVLLARFDDDVPKALAAYNLGEGKLAKLQRGVGEVSFWDPKLARALPTETRSYVPGVLAAAWIFAHAAHYGLTAPPETGVTQIVLRDPISIGELTMCLGPELNPGGWFRTLRNLNPRMSGSDRMDAGERFRMPSMLVPLYVDRCAGASPLLARARALYEERDEPQRGREYAQEKRR